MSSSFRRPGRTLIPVCPDDLILAPWAKIASRHGAGYHPLLCHLLDTAAVMHALWSQALPLPTRRLLALSLRTSETDACRWLAFLAALHDLGKAAPGFQARSLPHRRRLQRLGLSFPAAAEPSHVQVGITVLRQILPSLLPSAPARRLSPALATALGGHHGHTPRPRRCGERDLGDRRWEELRGALTAALLAHLSLQSQFLPEGLTGDNHRLLALIGGLARVADWLASDSSYFPPACGNPGGTADRLIPDDYAKTAAMQAGEAVHAMDWQQLPTDLADFAELFGFEPNTMQRTVAIAAGEMTGPALVIIEAPTGSGKTEAALHLARRWHACGHQNGYYVALPTQATAAALHQRLQRYDSPAAVQLLHAQAPPSAAPAGNAGKLLAPAGVGTLDQVLLAVANDRQAWVRLLGLASKTVIFDEVHAYDAYTTGLLTRLLGWLAALNCSVIMLSATLPERQRATLVQAWSKRPEPLPLASYPRVTVSAPGGLQTYTLPVRHQRHLALRHRPQDSALLADELAAALQNGGCAAVLCSTVAAAQNTYLALRERLEAACIPVDLFHARYPAAERRRREQAVLNRFGRDRAERPSRAVLVATQVVEQSLDLDFDLMVSDLAPVDVLLQRVGRLHRHPHSRPPGLANPCLWLLQPPLDLFGAPCFGPAAAVYHPHLLLRSWLLLRDRHTLQLPADTETLIEAVYGDALPADPEWQSELIATRHDLEQELLLQTHNAAAGARHVNAGLAPQPPITVHWHDLASAEIVCLQGDPGACHLDGQPFDLASEPPLPALDALRDAVVRLTGPACHELSRLPRPSWWAQHPQLRHVTPLYLDPEQRATLGSYHLQLHPDLGLTVTAADCPS